MLWQQRARPPIKPGRISFAALRAGDLAEHLSGDPSDAVAWLDAAARYGLVEAQVALGQCLLDGHGQPPDAAGAVRWFTIAAEAGYPPAMNMLGRCLEKGWGTPADLPCAASCYRRAAERSLDWGQYNLANMLLRGRGVLQDRGAAYGWFLCAARQGHAKSMNLVARFLEEGWEMPADPAAAWAWYRRSAEGGDYRGQYNWGSCLARQNRLAEAAIWFRLAAATATSDLLQIMAERFAREEISAFADAAAIVHERLVSR